MVFGACGAIGPHAQSLAVEQITKGLEYATSPIRKTKVTIAISTNQVALRQGDAVKLLAQVTSTNSLQYVSTIILVIFIIH